MTDADKKEETAEFTLPLRDFDDYAGKIKTYCKKYRLRQEDLTGIMGVKPFP